MSKKDISLYKYGISKHRYRELRYFCLQYDEWKEQRKALNTPLSAHSITSISKTTGNISDPTAWTAAKLTDLTEKLTLIEQTAIEAHAELYPYILKSVTQEIPYEYMDAPCGRQQFYKARQRFFCLLSDKR